MKKLISAVLALVMAVSFVSCSNTGNEASNSQNEARQIILTDQAGRELTFDEPAQTIVSSYYITTYAAIALGISDKIIGLEKKADKRPIYELAAPELLGKEQVGSMKEFNVEAVASLNPDLVLLPKKLLNYAENLESLGIKVMVVNPESHNELCQMLSLIGKACGAEDKANELIAYYESALSRLAKLTDGKNKPTVYFASNSSYMSTATDEMYQASVITGAGGANAAHNIQGNYWTDVSYESILAMNPQVIVIPADADYTADDIKNDSELKSIDAVKNDAVYQMPKGLEEWDSPVPSGILGTMWLTSKLHGDAYSMEEFKNDAKEFYQKFYGFELDTSILD